MSGRILVRGSDGALQEFPIRARLRIGSGAPNDVIIEGHGVLPLHATAEVRDEDCWIEAAGDGRMAINGQPVAKRALRHLDVITFGDDVHAIYSTSSAPLPQMQSGRQRKGAAPNPAATPNATRMFTRGDLAAPTFSPPTADAPSLPSNTIVGVPVATFTPPDAPPPTNTIVGMPIDVAAPAFAAEMPPTKEFRAPAVTPFTPTEASSSQEPGPRPIHVVRLTGTAGVFEAPLGRSIIGRGSKATLRIDSSEVSRVHAVLTVDTDQVTIEDRDSVNGTKVNGEPITGEHVLAEGDLLSFGTIDLRVDLLRLGGG